MALGFKALGVYECMTSEFDLFLQVFSFLKDVDLCQAAKVCRQWRAASAHEDFWKSLNFESRQVSHKQGALFASST